MEAPAPAAITASGWSGRHAVELYVRTYSTMLQSSGEIRLDSLVHAHVGMGSSLHPLASQAQLDMGALIYSVRRLPTEITRARRVILGQSARGFQAALGVDVGGWERVKAPARRRPWYHDGQGTLAVLLASPSDIDDLVPTLVAFQIGWNKLHRGFFGSGELPRLGKRLGRRGPPLRGRDPGLRQPRRPGAGRGAGQAGVGADAGLPRQLAVLRRQDPVRPPSRGRRVPAPAHR